MIAFCESKLTTLLIITFSSMIWNTSMPRQTQSLKLRVCERQSLQMNCLFTFPLLWLRSKSWMFTMIVATRTSNTTSRIALNKESFSRKVGCKTMWGRFDRSDLQSCATIQQFRWMIFVFQNIGWISGTWSYYTNSLSSWMSSSWQSKAGAWSLASTRSIDWLGILRFTFFS